MGISNDFASARQTSVPSGFENRISKYDDEHRHARWPPGRPKLMSFSLKAN
jgi:hypothetical protein